MHEDRDGGDGIRNSELGIRNLEWGTVTKFGMRNSELKVWASNQIPNSEFIIPNLRELLFALSDATIIAQVAC